MSWGENTLFKKFSTRENTDDEMIEIRQRSFSAGNDYLDRSSMAVDNISDEVVEKLIIKRAVPREMVSESKVKCPNFVQDEKVSAPEVSTAPETVQFTNEKSKVKGSKSVSVEGISSSNPLRKYLIGKRRGGISPSGNSVTKLGASASAEVLNLPVKPGTGTKRNLQESPSNPSTPSRRRNTNTGQWASPALRKGKKNAIKDKKKSISNARGKEKRLKQTKILKFYNIFDPGIAMNSKQGEVNVDQVNEVDIGSAHEELSDQS